MIIAVPENVRRTLDSLENAGFQAFVVGGCVRDAARGVSPRDWDVCTSATPGETAAVFADYRIIETGRRHGTLTVHFDGDKIEITTFRRDGQYSDNRRPDSVSFVRDIETDLSRRDFTMNAMAYNQELIDPFGGLGDIKARLIRCVGDAGTRFREDALRIMRALRFASELGFDIENDTRAALFSHAHLLKNIAAERKTAEFNRLLLGGAYSVITEYREVIAAAVPALPEKIPDAIINAPNVLETRLALLFGQTHSADVAAALRAMKYPRVFTREIARRVSRRDPHGVLPKISDLAVRGEDLIALGLSGREVGAALRALLELVISGEVENKREALLNKSRGYVRRR